MMMEIKLNTREKCKDTDNSSKRCHNTMNADVTFVLSKSANVLTPVKIYVLNSHFAACYTSI